jgi:hypothetical protein
MHAPILKRKLALTLLLSLAFLCGCAHEYLLVLKNGDQIIAFSKPKPQGTSYHFTDSSGEEHVIPQSRVVKIKTISVVKEEDQKPPSSPVQPKQPKHWYFLWLA